MIKKYNPDILTTLANLSSAEIFTPPTLAKEMLDLLPAEIWKNKNITFLDPAVKTGVFLREAASRLIKGLEKEIPNLQDRVNHIFKNQIYGIAITNLMGMMGRRSVYCAKDARDVISVANCFEGSEGNIYYHNINHTWKGEKCEFCSVKQSMYDLEEKDERHAYKFIHSENPSKIFNKKFDVIISNPPFSLGDGGGTGKSTINIYKHFVLKSVKMNPKYILMVTESKWFSGGKGLDDFRDKMLNDKRIKILVDYEDPSQCIPGSDIAGGLNYFLWDKDHSGQCEYTSGNDHSERKKFKRDLNEHNILIRNKQSLNINRKVEKKKKNNLCKITFPRDIFKIDNKEKKIDGIYKLLSASGVGKYSPSENFQNSELAKKWKVFLSKASYDHGGRADKDGKRTVLSKIVIGGADTVCSGSYLTLGPFKDRIEAVHFAKYLHTKFARFLISNAAMTQNLSRSSFKLVPLLDWSINWSDEMLFKNFGLTDDEVQYTENTIKDKTNKNEEI